MGKYDNLLKEAGEEDTTSLGKSKYSTLLAEAGDDEPEQMTQYKPAPVESKSNNNFFKLPDNIEKSLFSSSGVQATGRREDKLGGQIKQAVGMALDLLSAPTRALGKVRGYEMSDPQSALLRPEIDKAKTAIDEGKADKLMRAIPLFGVSTGINPIDEKLDKARRSVAKFESEAIGGVLSDPLFLGSLAKNAAIKPLKRVATKIESSILGKGNKSLLKKQGLTSEQAAKTALEENLGGSLKGTIKKINKRSGKLEEGIDNAIAEAKIKNPSLTIDVDEPLLRAGDRIEKGDPLLYGMTPQGKKAWSEWVDEMDTFNQLSKQSPEKAQEIKRMLGQKGFKKSNLGTPDLGAKETVTDLINLELRDDIAKAVPEIQKYNDEYKKILPIKKLAQNRLPVDQSNNILGLGSLVLGANKLTLEQIAKIVAYELSKSGTVAQGMYNTGKFLSKTPNAYGLSSGINMANALRKKEKD